MIKSVDNDGDFIFLKCPGLLRNCLLERKLVVLTCCVGTVMRDSHNSASVFPFGNLTDICAMIVNLC
jgi:hypothetical protein